MIQSDLVSLFRSALPVGKNGPYGMSGVAGTRGSYCHLFDVICVPEEYKAGFQSRSSCIGAFTGAGSRDNGLLGI